MTLQSLTLQNGYTSLSGGAIATNGTLNLTNVTLQNNVSAAYAGALGVFAGTTTINGCAFTGNSASNGGGAIATDGTLKVTSTTFSKNSAINAGGAISTDGTTNISGATFTGNSATDGAKNNGNGGAIANSGSGTLSVSGSSFKTDAAVRGGAVSTSGTGTTTLDGDSFTNETAYSQGGAIFARAPLTLTASLLQSNSSSLEGGALFNGSATATITGDYFYSNTSNGGSGGGAIYNDPGGALIIGSSTFFYDTADANHALGGGAIFSTSSSASTITTSTFDGNKSTNNGGAIFNGISSSGHVLTLAGTTFTGNTSGNDKGGAIWNAGNLALGGSLLAYDGTNECAGGISFIAEDYNLITDTTCGTGAHDVSGAPNLGPLNYNGGTTNTISLLNGSAAINAIPSSTSVTLNGITLTLCPATADGSVTDQRGVARPQGSGCDMGAYEVVPPTLSITTPANGSSYVYGQAVAANYTCGAGSDPALPIACTGTADAGSDISTTVGPHTFTATATDAGGYAVSATTNYTVTQAKSQTTLSIPTLTVGTAATLTVVVAPVAPGNGTPTGTVTLTDNTSAVVSTATLSGGKATFSYTPTDTSSGKSLTATYGGDGNFTGSAVTQSLSAQQGATTTTLSGVANTVFGQSLTLSATVTAGGSTPTGTVTFLDGTTVLGTGTLAGGSTTLTIASLGVGAHSLTARYDGDTNYLTSTSAAQAQTVTPAATATLLTSTVNPTVVGQVVQVTTTVTALAPGAGIPGGSVKILDGTTILGTATLDGTGKATFTTASLTVGTHHLTASYVATTDFAASTSAVLSQTVNPVQTPAPTSTQGAVRFAQGTTFASVDVAIDGNVVFPNVLTHAVTSYLPLAAGSHTVTVYGPSGSGTSVLTLPLNVAAGADLTVGLTGGGTASAKVADATSRTLSTITGGSTLTATVFTDDLTIASQAAKVRVYDLAASLGTLGNSLGSSLTPLTASQYYTEAPGTATVSFTPGAGKPFSDTLQFAENQVYSIFVFDGPQVANTVTAGVPSTLPQTGSAPVNHGLAPWVIALLVALVLLGGAGGGAWFWRRSRLAR